MTNNNAGVSHFHVYKNSCNLKVIKKRATTTAVSFSYWQRMVILQCHCTLQWKCITDDLRKEKEQEYILTFLLT